jgi:hypothetical protein
VIGYLNSFIFERLQTYRTTLSRLKTPSTVFVPPHLRKAKKKPQDPVFKSKKTEATTPSRVFLTSAESQYLISLLLSLDSLLTSDEISTLRDVARTCADVVNELEKPEDLVNTQDDPQKLQEVKAGCWMIVMAVLEGWGQRDLWQMTFS